MNVITTPPPADPHIPWMIGCLRNANGNTPHPLSAGNIASDAAFAKKMFHLWGIGAGSTVLLTSGSSELAQFWPYEVALVDMETCLAVAENLPFDAGRSEMFLRRLRVDLALAVGVPVLDGLVAMGFDIAQVYRQAKLIVARADAHERLRQAGLSPWRLVEFGPAFGFVAPDGETFHDNTEWTLDAPNGEILISSRQSRAHRLTAWPTGVYGRVDASGAFHLG